MSMIGGIKLKIEERTIKITEDSRASFHNQVDLCVGTGRMGLALQREYQEQLKLVQEEIGFSYIRGHGLFSDDMAIYQEHERGGEHTIEYNFTYLDLVMDRYLELGIRPFLELGFMPAKLASGTQTIFYWRGNTTPPKDYKGWDALVQATLSHLMERYGADEVVTWPIEVWNEPNLPGFWEHADMQEYFKLFEETFFAIKEVDERFRVGGPAICGVNDEVWIREFLEFCEKKDIMPDFVTRHHYTTELPEPVGHYGYAELMDAEEGFRNLHTTREIVDSFPQYKGKEIHITEFNSSYIPNCPLHDTNKNAAWIAHQLSRLGDDNESYSYWTFGDIFEEHGVPFTPFHGGFGLVANGCIPKPTFWSFAFFKRLKKQPGTCVFRDDNAVIMRMEDGSCRGVAWNAARTRSGRTLELQLELPAPEDTRCCLVTETVSEKCCNPLRVWHDLGEPANPSKEQIALLQRAAQPQIDTAVLMPEQGNVKTKLTLEEYALVYFELRAAALKSDRGYSYERVAELETN